MLLCLIYPRPRVRVGPTFLPSMIKSAPFGSFQFSTILGLLKEEEYKQHLDSRSIPSTGLTHRNAGSPSGDLDKNRGRWRWGRRGVWTERSGVLSKKMKRPPSLSLPRLDRDPVSVKITPPLIREGSHLDRGDFRPFCMASSAVCAAVSLSSENKEMSDERPKRGLGPLKNTEGVKAGELPYFYPFLPLLVCLSQQVSLSPLSIHRHRIGDIFGRRRILGHLFMQESGGEIGFGDFPPLIEMA